MSELCVPLSSALSAQEAAQLGFNCISTQLVQTPLRPTLEDLKWSLEQAQPRMHQTPLHTLECSHPCSWGANHSISFHAGESKRPANYWCQGGQGKQGKNLSRKALPGFTVNHQEEFNPSPFYLHKHTQCRSSALYQGTRKPQHCSQPSICRRDHHVTHTHCRLAIFGFFFVCT